MNGWPGAEGISGGFLPAGLAGFVPIERRQLFDVPVGGAGQPLQHVFQIGLGLDAMHPAVGDQGVDGRVAP